MACVTFFVVVGLAVRSMPVLHFRDQIKLIHLLMRTGVRRKQPGHPHKQRIDGEQEAQIIALLCSERPSGQERVAHWQAKRQASAVTIYWRFTAEDARIKLKRFYPSIEEGALVEQSVD